MKRLKRILLVTCLLLVVLAVITFFMQQPDRELRISRETTRLTGPLRDDGTVDYLAAVNARLSEGVTNDNNVVVGLLESVSLKQETDSEYASNIMRALNLGRARPEHPWIDIHERMEERFPMDPRNDESVEIRLQERDQVWQPWHSAELPHWAEVLEQQNQALDLVVQASKRERYYYPLVCNDSDPSDLSLMLAPMDLPNQIRSMAIGLHYRAMNRVAEGDIGGAIEDIRAIRRLSRLMRQSSTLIEMLIANGIAGVAFEAEQHLINSDQVSQTQLEDYRRFLAEPQPLAIGLPERVDFAERFMLLQTTLAGFRGRDSAEGGMVDESIHDLLAIGFATSNVNQALMTINEEFDRIHEMLSGDPRQRLDVWGQWENDMVELERKSTDPARVIWKCVAGPKSRGSLMGSLMILQFVPAVFQIDVAEIRSELQISMIDTAIALEMFHRQHGEYPEKLERLVGQQLDSVPEDWLGSTPLNYRRTDEGYVLYSVGRDGADNRGHKRDDVRVLVGRHPDYPDEE